MRKRKIPIPKGVSETIRITEYKNGVKVKFAKNRSVFVIKDGESTLFVFRRADLTKEEISEFKPADPNVQLIRGKVKQTVISLSESAVWATALALYEMNGSTK